MSGVALPNTTLALCNLPSTDATRSAEYLGDWSCFNDGSWASSTTTRPTFDRGANRADLAPMITKALSGFEIISVQDLCLSASDMLE